MQYAWNAGYDPAGFTRFFDKMATHEGYVKGLSWFRTHPPFYERMVETQKEILFLPEKEGLIQQDTAFEEMKKELAMVTAQAEQDEQDRPSLLAPEAGCPAPGKVEFEPGERRIETICSLPIFLRYIGFMAVLLVAVAAPIRADSVSLYAAVEKDGVLLSGLTENNFRLYEDGELRPFRLEEPETPATIAVLVEYSRNSWLYYNDILRAMEGFFSKAPDGNWYALATFSNTLNVRVDFTKLRGKIASSFADLPAPLWSEVNTYDAVYEMLEKMDRLPGRRVLIIIGSGADTFSELTLQDVQRKAERANVVIYAAGAGSQLRGQYESYLDNVTRLNLLQAESFS